MTTVDAYEDSVATVRHWQNRGVTLAEISGQLGLASRCDWQHVIEHIVTELLIAAEGGQLSLRLAA